MTFSSYRSNIGTLVGNEAPLGNLRSTVPDISAVYDSRLFYRHSIGICGIDSLTGGTPKIFDQGCIDHGLDHGIYLRSGPRFRGAACIFECAYDGILYRGRNPGNLLVHIILQPGR